MCVEVLMLLAAHPLISSSSSFWKEKKKKLIALFCWSSSRYEDVNHYEEKAPYGKMAHPSPEHFYPLHVAMGAAGEDAKAEQIHQSWQLCSLSCSCYKFTAATASWNFVLHILMPSSLLLFSNKIKSNQILDELLPMCFVCSCVGSKTNFCLQGCFRCFEMHCMGLY